MAFSITPDLSFCLIDGNPIFLDIEADRYFTLPSDRTDALLAEQSLGATIEELPIQSSTCSILELPTLESSGGLPAFLEVAAITLSVRLQLKRKRLRLVLDELPSRASQGNFGATDAVDEEGSLLRACTIFRRARPHVPIPTRCLLDSISLIHFLARRGFHSDLVFGVTTDPFTAHSWVQRGNMVLNDTLGNTRTYTPIKVI
ncbi:lasso peptide biosynthesis B2 protein [Pseudoxanthomonas composti]|uniref:Lasso peptide biosynthesis B2 protein n=1 Tax=Pseudoxanthomonas composti TaxID=2137479 RepID=A0A4Q1JWS0_9GAMM|nr:lasso peptide biosynthesis B2 protein [Pseudoxanthomonas composti]RXR07055.1 lasso peptide biosynthesis B2 protein [Pseudoxanthomonas composti]